MSERTCLLIASLLLLPARQVPAQEDAALRARLDSLAAEYEQVGTAARAARAAEAQARAARERQPVDTAQDGPFQLVARKRDMAVVKREFSAAWARLVPFAGRLAADVAPHRFVVSVGSPLPPPRSRFDGRSRQVWLTRWRFGAVQRSAAEGALGDVLFELLPPGVRNWSGRGYFRGPTRWGAVYRELATSAALPARRCFAGDAPSCLAALALEPARDDPASWYSRAMIRARALAVVPVVRSAERQACERGALGACLSLLPPGAFPPPVSKYARVAFAQLALERGGASSLERLARGPGGTVAGRLQAAAGEPLEQLAREWREQALRARPVAHAGIGVALVATVFWSVLFLLLATRSTRCRAG